VEFPELKRRVVELAGLWHPHAVLVEDAASGQSLLQELKKEPLPILALKPDSDKLSRAHAVTPLIEAGRVLLPESAPWLDTLVDELSSFPNAPHDDIVDSLTQALAWLRVNANTGPSSIYTVSHRPQSNILGGSDKVLQFPEIDSENPKNLFSGGIRNKVL
jgi:predicted phage terminase large subunit-like protein